MWGMGGGGVRSTGGTAGRIWPRRSPCRTCRDRCPRGRPRSARAGSTRAGPVRRGRGTARSSSAPSSPRGIGRTSPCRPSIRARGCPRTRIGRCPTPRPRTRRDSRRSRAGTRRTSAGGGGLSPARGPARRAPPLAPNSESNRNPNHHTNPNHGFRLHFCFHFHFHFHFQRFFLFRSRFQSSR